MRLFSGTEIKMILLVVAAATVAAVVTAVVAGTSRKSELTPGLEEEIVAGSSIPDISEIIVPKEFTLRGGERWYFSREPLSRWNEDQIREFWIDPAEIGIDLMEEETDRAVKDFIEGIP